MEQAQYAARVVDQAVFNFRANIPFEWPQPHCKVQIKSEVHHAFTISEAEFDRITTKAREYFIPDLPTIANSQVVQGYRQKIERGGLIRIGMDWNKGGMQVFAEYFDYENPDMRYITFDISGYDTSVIKMFLQLYSRWAMVYYKFPSADEKKLFQYLLDQATHRLATKIAQMIGNIWRIIDGVMPSGAYETSHGDSWITALVYFCMFEYFSATDFEFRKLYKEDDSVRLAVYGDDNVLGFHKKLLPWFTELKITEFFTGFGNFSLRDFEIHDSFLSIPDGMGGLKHKGVVFLQKYCILTPVKYRLPGMPKVVQYRPLEVSVRKFVKGSGDKRTNLDYFLSALSGVYDNPFNQQWHDFCFYMYHAFMPKGDWSQYVDELLKNSSGYLTRTLRKCQIDMTVLKKGFPLPQQIVDLSILEREHHRNKYKDIWTTSLVYDD